MHRLGPLSVLASVLALAACGQAQDDNDRTFNAAANEICHEASTAERDLNRGLQPMEEDEDAIAYFEARKEFEERQLRSLRGLDPPSEHEDLYAEYVTLKEEGFELLEEAVGAARQSNPDGVHRAAAERNERGTRARELAREMDLRVCGGVLEEEIQGRLVETTRAALTGETPCEDAFSRRYLNELHGGNAARCERQRKPAEDIAPVAEPRGVDEVSGSFLLEARGGEFDGAPYGTTLVYEGGSWKVDELVELPPGGQPGEEGPS